LALSLVANIILISALVAIGWGLRGSAYEPGRPSAEDVMLEYVRYALLATLFMLDIVFPVFWFSRRRFVLTPRGCASTTNRAGYR
jgi:hypothetical protein